MQLIPLLRVARLCTPPDQAALDVASCAAPSLTKKALLEVKERVREIQHQRACECDNDELGNAIVFALPFTRGPSLALWGTLI